MLQRLDGADGTQATKDSRPIRGRADALACLARSAVAARDVTSAWLLDKC